LLRKDWEVWWCCIWGVQVKVPLLPAVKDIGPDETDDLGVKDIAIELVLAVCSYVLGPLGGYVAVVQLVPGIQCLVVRGIALEGCLDMPPPDGR